MKTMILALALSLIAATAAQAACTDYSTTDTTHSSGRTHSWTTCSAEEAPLETIDEVPASELDQATIDRNNAKRALMPSQPKEIPMPDPVACAACRAPQ